jgi:hypothetical protein
MAYTIKNTDGTTLLLLADGTIDEITTSLTLIGKNYNGFGAHLNNNLIKILGNSANTINNPPVSPIKGQLWYDTTRKRLQIYDGSFRPVSGAISSSSQPPDLVEGDLWWDTTNSQLKIYRGSGLPVALVGPAFSASIGENGWVLPTTQVRDPDNYLKNITVIKNYGNTLGYISDTAFIINTATTYSYLTTGTTTATVKGLTILGDIQFSGKITSNFLTLDLNLSYLTTSDDLYLPANTSTQNIRIAAVLRGMFPINTGTTTMQNFYNSSPSLKEVGVPVYSQARVLCYSTSTPNVYQIRLFEAATTGAWLDKYVSSSYTATNTICEFTRI